MNVFLAPLKFLNLLDRGNKISITNLALLILLVKVAVMPTLALPDVAAFFMVLLNYGHKRIETNKAIAAEAKAPSLDQVNLESVPELQKKFDELESRVSGLSLQAGLTRKS